MKKASTYLVGAASAARKSALVGVFALAAFSFGASASWATVMNIGDLGAQTSGCTHAAGDDGLVCNSPQIFTDGTLSVTAKGWSATPGSSTPTPITFKPNSAPFGGAPANGLDESGLGQNTLGPTLLPGAAAPHPCDEPQHAADCEIGGLHSVTIEANRALDDVGIGSVQSGERFQLFTGPDINHLTGRGFQTCATVLCEINDLGPGIFAIAVQGPTVGMGDILITQLSYTTNNEMPEPASLALLGTALAGLGFIRRRRRSITAS